MDINELLVNLKAQIAKLSAMINEIKEQMNDIEAFFEEQTQQSTKTYQKRTRV